MIDFHRLDPLDATTTAKYNRCHYRKVTATYQPLPLQIPLP